jgi:hypothetical protein
MTWVDFKAEASYLRAKEGELFKRETDSVVENLKLEQAKADLRWDIEQVLGVSIQDATDFLNANAEYIKEMLALRQLYWYFLERSNGEGSVTQQKSETYRRLYEQKKIQLGSLKIYNRPNVDTLLVMR